MSELQRKTRYKGCDCGGTSSGPRLVYIVPEPGVMRLINVPFACDVCDEPWSEWMEPWEPTPERRTAGEG